MRTHDKRSDAEENSERGRWGWRKFVDKMYVELPSR